MAGCEKMDKEEEKLLKEALRQLHSGEEIDNVKERLKEILRKADATDIAKIEEELIKEGLSMEEMHKLCDIHLAVLKESIEKEKINVPEWHPLHILMEEHKMLLKFADQLKDFVENAKNMEDSAFNKKIEELKNIVHHLKESESHYVREENVLFPYLEKHGVTQPPAVMWMEHDKIREAKKNIYEIVQTYHSFNIQDFVKRLENLSFILRDMLSNHFYKENNILFPTALNVIKEQEWRDIRNQFDKLGYCCFTPALQMVEETKLVDKGIETDLIHFETGILSKEEIGAIFNSLPVDITFVDAQEKVKYFSQSKERIFTRTKAIIGRKVQQCHPQKSVHMVNQILEDFKKGNKDKAEFWINLNDRLIYIRYFAVRNENGNYLGCLEVTQDITDIKNIKGEKRLL